MEKFNEVTAHNTLTGEVSLEGSKQPSMKLNYSTPRIVACIPVGGKQLTSRFKTPDEQVWESPTNILQGLIPAPWVMAHMQMIAPLGMGIHYLFRWGLLSGEARQIMTMTALERVQEDGYIWYLDDDVIMPPYGLFTLYNFMEQHPEAGLVTGVYASRTTPTEPFIYKEHHKGAHWGLTVGPDAKAEEIFGCGAGFMLARVSAIRDMMKLYPGTPIWADARARKYEGSRKDEKDIYGENWGHDLRFCRLMQEAGWKVYVDGRVECGHYNFNTGETFRLPDDSPPKVRGRKQSVLTYAKMALVLPTYNDLEYAAKAAKSFRENTKYDTTIIAINDAWSGITDEGFKEWAVANCIDHAYRFAENGGLTRSWNYGLSLARSLGCQYTVIGNADTIFSPGWDTAIRAALETYHLVGPVSNAPGWGSQSQNVVKYLPDYKLTDDLGSIAATAKALEGQQSVDLSKRAVGGSKDGQTVAVLPEILNGFTMVAKTDTWWSGAYNKDFVFNPLHKMTENELELQLRWALADRTSAVVPASFVFHYRSISRGEEYVTEGTYRENSSSNAGDV